YAATSNLINKDFNDIFHNNTTPYLQNAIKDALIDCIAEDQNISSESITEKNLDSSEIDYTTLLSNKEYRKLLSNLSEKYPKNEILSFLVDKISQLGYQREVATINSASLYPNIFFEMLAQILKKLKNADDGNISSEINELWQLVGQREHTYFMAQYLLQEACVKAGESGYPYQRIIEELEGRVYEKYERPLVATHIQILLESLPIDGKNPISLSLVSILQSGRAAPGDVVTVFSFYSDDEDSNTMTESLEDKYLWLVAYAALSVDSLESDPSLETVERLSRSKIEINKLVSLLKEIKKKLVPIATMIDFNRMLGWLLDIIKTPIVALLVTEWIKSILSANNYNYYEAYYRSSEVPIPLLLLEEIAFVQPQLRPQIFSAYVESFYCRVESFLPEIRINFQRTMLGLMINMVQMGYGLAVSRFIIEQSNNRNIDESLVVIYVSEVLEMTEAPYSADLSMLLLQIIAKVLKALLDTPSIHPNLRSFLSCICNESSLDVIGEMDPVAIESSMLLLRALK
ncbi:Negative elongation factor D, partial [Smittium mucronatum]